MSPDKGVPKAGASNTDEPKSPDNKVPGANMGPTWGQHDPGGPMWATWTVLHCILRIIPFNKEHGRNNENRNEVELASNWIENNPTVCSVRALNRRVWYIWPWKHFMGGDKRHWNILWHSRCNCWGQVNNTFSPTTTGCHFADEIFKFFLVWEGFILVLS